MYIHKLATVIDLASAWATAHVVPSKTGAFGTAYGIAPPLFIYAAFVLES